MKYHLQSKTLIGLFVILLASCTMAYFGKLTPELVDIFKYVGSGFMLVRGTANFAENKYASSASTTESK